ncbi:hypothetical protein AB833_23020 [Chromatiales bacterium (ex Bugula neritina AB1)]|nr:hypothetical protein AB833_23020 [Chromatiales bacterium (ex Bugula neritina AB1)]
MCTLLATIKQLAGKTATAFNAVGTLSVLGLVAVVNYDVVARGVFSAPFMGAVEIVQFSLVFIVFLQLPDVVRVNRLTRSDGFLLLTGKRYPRLSSILQRLIDSLSFVFMGLIVYAMWPEFTEMWESQDFFGVPGVFTAPWWPVKLVIVLSAILCTLLFVCKSIIPDKSTRNITDA